jgi:hypothetical protein
MALHPRNARFFFAASLLAGLFCSDAHAALPDEIQVYVDDIHEPGRYGLELHVNATPDGITTPDYPGEIVAAGGTRITPEFAYGLPYDLEAGAYLPVVHESNGDLRATGIKLRLKWVPIKQADEGPGVFAGLNGELSQVRYQFESERRGFEMRPFIGWRNTQWLVAVNPVLDFALQGPDRHEAPDFAPSLKVARTVAPGIATGLEYYTELGTINDIRPWSETQETLYWAIDIDRPPWNVNFAIGRGLTAITDRWTIKMIIEIPLGR